MLLIHAVDCGANVILTARSAGMGVCWGVSMYLGEQAELSVEWAEIVGIKSKWL